MKEIFEIIITYSKQYPVLIPFIVFGFFYLKNETFRTLTNKTVLKIFKISFSNHILAHDLFFQKRLWQQLINRMFFSSPDKTKLYRILLEEKVKCVISTIELKIKENKKLIRSNRAADILALMIEIINEATRKFEENLLTRFMHEYGNPTGKNLFNIIYTANFKAVQDENIERLINRISSPAFLLTRNSDDMFRSYFTKIQDRLDDTIADAKETFDEINGGIEQIINQK
jgi:hypothetical protein